MNRMDFMRELESLLQKISPTEREEALQYYNDYFDDAGPDNEQEVIEALGNPARVAENIKRELLANGYGDGYGDDIFVQATASDRAVIAYEEITGTNDAPEGSPDANWEEARDANWEEIRDVNWDEQPEESQELARTEDMKGKDSKDSNGIIILIVILCILFSPILLGTSSGILGAVFGIIAAWFSIILGFGITALALLAVFVVLTVVAALCLVTDPLVAAAIFGGGLICAGIGILFLMLTVAMAGVATPAIFRGISSLVKKICGKNKETVVE